MTPEQWDDATEVEEVVAQTDPAPPPRRLIGEEFGDALYNWKRDPSPDNTRLVVSEGVKLMQAAASFEQLVDWYERDVPPQLRANR